MASERLYEELARALAQPSHAYRAAKEAINIPLQGLEGYRYGQNVSDEFRQRKLKQQPLYEALGGQDVESGLLNMTGEQGSIHQPALGIYASLKKSEPNDNWLTKFNLQQAEIMKRQKDRQDFIRSMVGAKGNKDAVAEAQDALKASESMQSLNDDLDKLSPTMSRLNSTVAAKILEPKIAAKKSQVLLYAGFSRGGKQLTGTELGVVVDALTPTGFDNKASRHLKNATFQDWAQGKIGLLDAAKLLGPAGVPLVKIAQDQKLKADQSRDQLIQGLNNESDPYSALGL